MIDWLNFIIGIVFTFAGIAFVISAWKHYLQHFGTYLVLLCVGVLFFMSIGVGLVWTSDIYFDSALHECTEWECPVWDGVEGELNFGEEGNPVCKYKWANGEGERSFVGDRDSDILCVVFREKTRAELDADFCNETPTSDKCDCVEYETLIRVNISSAQTCQMVNVNLNKVYACFTTDNATDYEGLELPELEIFGKTRKPEIINDELLYYDELVCVGAVPKVTG